MLIDSTLSPDRGSRDEVARHIVPSRRGGCPDSDGVAVFEHACKLGLEGIVSKRRDMRYRSGRSKAWLKIRNSKSPAMLRVEDWTF